MKFELSSLPRGASIEEIKAEIIRVAGLISDPVISKKKFDELSKISTSALTRRFGSWEEALTSCQLEHRYGGRIVSSKMKSQVARTLTDQELIVELQRVAAQMEKVELSQPDFNENSELSSSVIRSRFGSWSKGLKAAGLAEVKKAKRYTELDYFENLLNVWTHYGRQPYYGEMNAAPSQIGSGSYERRWGKWSTALIAFIEYANSDRPAEIALQPEVSSTTEQSKKPKMNKRDIPLGLRYRVYTRDRFRCVKCGNSPASDLNCKLHVDHIIPYSKGGLTEFENLQTACSDCNLGKGNRYEE